jgi:simple sugar transport system permease protein
MREIRQLVKVNSLLRRLFVIVPQALAVVTALIATAFILYLMGRNPWEIYYIMLFGSFGDIYSLGATLTQATPIIFTGLGFMVAFRSGLFNVGLEGQLYLGAFAAAYVGFTLTFLPPVLHIITAIFAGALVGGLWALIAIIPKIKTGAHEVITGLMLTYVAILLTSYLVNYPFKATGWAPYSPFIAESAQLPRILPPTQLSFGWILAIIFAGFVYVLLNRTTIGYEIRVLGINKEAAVSAGININRTMILAFTLSGCMSGMGGAIEVLGVHRRFIDLFSPGYGWDGIAVGLLGNLNPIGAIFAALLLGALRAGGSSVQMITGLPLDIVTMVQGIIILFLAAPMLYRFFIKKIGEHRYDD